MNAPASLYAVVDPVISLVPSLELRDSLRQAFSLEPAAVASIEEVFRVLPQSGWSGEVLQTFAGSWKATHLKMLAIYGLSCRLQRAAEGALDSDRSNLYLAAARNAATSYEDLGLDFDGHTHAELYEDFAEALTGGDHLAVAEVPPAGGPQVQPMGLPQHGGRAHPRGPADQHVLGDLQPRRVLHRPARLGCLLRGAHSPHGPRSAARPSPTSPPTWKTR